MKPKYLIWIAALFFAGTASAQNNLKGTVYEYGKSTRLPDVFIKDMNNNRQITITDKNGNFSIATVTGHTLIFNSPGYVSDTLYVTDLRPKRIDLKTQTISLKEVNISAKKEVFDPHKEYPEIYTRSKVYPFSPSSWFGKSGRDARRLKRYFKREEEQREVDQVYTDTYVMSLIPLRGRELVNFMSLYRPTYALLKDNNGESVAMFVKESYQKYQALPPEKRALPTLTGGADTLQ